MNKQRNLILILAIGLIFYLNSNVQAKVNVTEELWEEDTLSLNESDKSEHHQKQTRKPGDPIIIDVLDLKNMDILDVLKLISQKSGLNIVAGSNVKGRVTVFLKNVDVHEALRIIVQAYGWAYDQDDEIMRVMTDKEFEDKHGHKFDQETETRIRQLNFIKATDAVAVLDQIKGPSGKIIAEPNLGVLILTDEPDKLDKIEKVLHEIDVDVKTEVFTLSYAAAENMASKIEELITPSIGNVKYDDRTNRVVVSDTAPKIEKIRQVVSAFDRKDKEVLIESKIMQITLSDEYKLGIDWEGIVEDYHNLDLVGDFDVLGANDKHGTLSIGTVASDRYALLVQALETVGQTNILSSPRIATVNNQEAKILVGSTEPYVTSTTTTPASGPTTVSEAVNFIEVGVKLFVTPTIHEDDFITMKIKPEVSSVTSNLTTSNNNTIPVVETSEAETTIMVKDKVTIVIGGLIKEETINSTKKIPVLGDIPFLGIAFRNQNDSKRKTEIVIFLTPEIITGDISDPDLLAAF